MAVRISGLTDRAAVEAAIELLDQLGRDEFLQRYGYSRARSYFLKVDGRLYDSKAIAGVALGLQYPDQPMPVAADFSGGDRTVAQVLRRLGFRVVEPGSPLTREISREAVLAAIDEWDAVGRDEFLARHDLRAANRYAIEHQGRRYDAKAIVVVAHRNERPDEPLLQPGDFRGDRRSIRLPLERLGFHVVDVRTPVEVRGWDLDPGDLIRRGALHELYGGGQQGGISMSAQTPNVIIFSDPSTGERHGYFDRWEGDEFHYAGEGQRGDQVLQRGNRAILEHKGQGKALRVFWGSSGIVQYAGEFEISDTEPCYWVSAPETGGGPERQVVMFRLMPVGMPSVFDADRPERPIVEPQLATDYRSVDPNQDITARAQPTVDPDKVGRGLRGHTSTQESLAEAVRAHGLLPLSPGRGDPTFDLAWRDPSGATVVEVKSLTDANESSQIRLGLGQVLDYQALLERTGDPVRPVLALECQPRHPRWEPLCRRHGVTLCWPESFELLFT